MPRKYVPTGLPSGRPLGYRMSPEGRAKISAKSSAAHARRGAKLELCDALIEAITAGNMKYAKSLVQQWKEGVG